MLNFISFLTGSAHPESREFPSPSGRGSFRMRAGKEKKLFPSSLFLFLWRVSHKKKKRGVRTTFAEKFPIERE
jgi:hypothetical protein